MLNQNEKSVVDIYSVVMRIDESITDDNSVDNTELVIFGSEFNSVEGVLLITQLQIGSVMRVLIRMFSGVSSTGSEIMSQGCRNILVSDCNGVMCVMSLSILIHDCR